MMETMSLSTLNSPVIQVVKAIIYRSDGHLFMQQRDYAPELIFPGCWTFFGGQVDAGERLKDALKREMLEEIGCIPGHVGDELFQWKWLGEPPSQNHYFPVCCEVDDESFLLNEGQDMAWCAIEDIKGLALTPDITETFPKISLFVDQIKCKNKNDVS